MVLSVAQVCEMLGCSRSRVFELLADGTLERAPRYGRQIRIYTASVEKALSQTKRHTVRGPRITARPGVGVDRSAIRY